MKKEVPILAFFTFLTSLSLINFVSAQFFWGYGGQFSLAQFFDSLDPSTVVYGLLFFILFTFILMALTRMSLFRGKNGEPNNIAAAAVSFSVSALIVYYLYRSGYNLESFFYELGFSGDLYSLLLAVLVVIVSIFVIMKFKLPGFLIISGLLAILIALFTDLIYEKGIVLVIGILLVIIGLSLGKAARKWWKQEIRAT